MVSILHISVDLSEFIQPSPSVDSSVAYSFVKKIWSFYSIGLFHSVLEVSLAYCPRGGVDVAHSQRCLLFIKWLDQMNIL